MYHLIMGKNSSSSIDHEVSNRKISQVIDTQFQVKLYNNEKIWFKEEEEDKEREREKKKEVADVRYMWLRVLGSLL